MARILVSYRRLDTDAIAGRIRDHLSKHYGDDAVFMDIDSIPFGKDFRAHVREALLTNDILLAVIGPKWAGPIKNGVSRINEDTDPVRIELETALQRGIPVIPVLVGGAKMPRTTALPAALKDLPFLNAAEVEAGRDFNQHVERLIRAMDSILNIKSAPFAPSLATQSPERSQSPHKLSYQPELLAKGLPAFSDDAQKSEFGEFFRQQSVGQARIAMAIGVAAWIFTGISDLASDKPPFLIIEYRTLIAIPTVLLLFALINSKLAQRFWQPFLSAISIIATVNVIVGMIVSYETAPQFDLNIFIIGALLTISFGCLMPLGFVSSLWTCGVGFSLVSALLFFIRQPALMTVLALICVICALAALICVAFSRERAFRLLFLSLNRK
jgi:hypothetical protein